MRPTKEDVTLAAAVNRRSGRSTAGDLAAAARRPGNDRFGLDGFKAHCLDGDAVRCRLMGKGGPAAGNKRAQVKPGSLRRYSLPA